MPACLRGFRADDADAPGARGSATAAVALPGPLGSGFMMLTAGIDEALGKSMSTATLREPGEDCGDVASAIGASSDWAQAVR